ncbi:MAG TPA: alpha/beta hydrolase [Geminicoccaceae bacterium]|nr:alpha/beta hydrolase [Geminicoccaceae bacterium]
MDAPAARLDRPDAAPSVGAALELDHVLVDGMRVRIAHRGHGRAQALGTVVVLTGRAEFVEKYEETLGELASLGFASAIFDWRGQGGSDRFLDHRHRGHVVQVEDYLADLAAVLDWVERRRLPEPFLMLGHSMGGHVGLRFLGERPGRFVGAVLSAPMFGINLGPLPGRVAQAICALAVRAGAGHRYAPGQRDFDLARCLREANRLTSCDIRLEDLRRRLAATPELALGGVTYGWLGAALRSIALARRPGFLESIATPVLVCQAGIERIVSNRAQVEVARRLPRGRLVVFPEARHELLRERDPIRRRFFQTFAEFAADVTP